MPLENDSVVVDFDADAAVEAARDVAGSALRAAVEFDRETFTALYVDDGVLAMYDDDEDAMREHFAEVHDYVHLDVTETELFTEDLFPVADEVEYIVTALDAFSLVRVYIDGEGLFLSLDPGEPVQPVVAAVRAAT